MLKSKIKKDSVKALKDRDLRRVGVLRFLLSLIDKKALKLPLGEMKNQDVLVVLQKELKNKKESKQMFEKAGRQDLVKEIEYEIEVLEAYLPKEMEEKEVRVIVKKIVDKNKGANFGVVMGKVMAELKGKADGGLVSRLARETI